MKRWFLPSEPDVLGRLREQAAITIEGLDALLAWAGGDESQGQAVADAEHRADEAKRVLQRELRSAFSTPLDPEDVYELSERLDVVLGQAKDLVREAELIAVPPDQALHDMVACVVEAVAHLAAAFDALPKQGDLATARADDAKRAARKLEKAYRAGMSGLLRAEGTDLPQHAEQAGRREEYRRASQMGDAAIAVAERIWYATVKEG